MSSQAQIRANQRNAQKSTGPKTEEGKARAARNARIHGLCAQTLVFPSESEREDFLVRCQEISDQYPVEHALKQSLVTAIATAEVQIRIIGLAKRGAFRQLLAGLDRESPDRPQPGTDAHIVLIADLLGLAFTSSETAAATILKLNRYELEQRRLFHKAFHELEALNKQHKAEPAPKPAATFSYQPQTGTKPFSQPANARPPSPTRRKKSESYGVTRSNPARGTRGALEVSTASDASKSAGPSTRSNCLVCPVFAGFPHSRDRFGAGGSGYIAAAVDTS